MEPIIMNKRISLIFLILAALVVVGVFNFDIIKTQFQFAPESDDGVVQKRDLTKKEVVGFLDRNAWYDYNSKSQPLDLSTVAANKVIYIHIWASWCGPCLNEIPELIDYAQKNKGSTQFILISLDDSQTELDKFLKSFPEMKESHFIKIWDYDKKISKKLDVDRLPMTIILKPTEDAIKSIRSVVNWKSL